ncbi:hypothetical protein SDC9_139809 [bioreactor metagenome]|uniref:Uncharacterized protein n=1 Tax=bioreactor metagenome TaxID=1076179 RepID=A0A645DT56_9ZZZZ
MISDLNGFFQIHDTRVVELVKIATFDRNDRFIVGEPFFYAVAEQLEADAGVIRIGIHDFFAFPAPFLL